MTDKEKEAYKAAKEAIARCAREQDKALLLAPLDDNWGVDDDDDTVLDGSLPGPLVALPESLFSLSHLETLYISNANLSSLPEGLLRLPNLRCLLLHDTGLRRLPAWLREMKSLKHLILHSSPLLFDELELPLPPGLENITLGTCGLQALPREIWNLPKLWRLSVVSNPLQELPQEIGLLTGLRVINLYNCELTSLPPALLELAERGTLKELYLTDNPALELSDAVLGPAWHNVRGKRIRPARPLDILTAYFDKQKAKDSHSARLFREARVVLVGDGLAGKTSLANWLVSGTKTDPKKRQQTLGVDILEWKITAIPKRGELMVRVWDFGGQELMHETHQKLFLGEEAVYVMVVNKGGDDPATKIRYWLKLIRAQAPQARILVALNHCDDGTCALSDRDLPAEGRDNFPAKALFPTSCTKGHGLPALKEALLHELAGLREPWLPWAPEYFAVKEKMAALKKKGLSHVTLDYYVQVCGDAGLKEEGGRNALLACLDHAGLLVRVPRVEDDDRALLEPEWLTSGLYRVLNHAELADARGLLHKADLARWLDKQRYTEADRAWLLRVMVAYELAFDSGGTWFVPPLLQQSPNEGAEAAAAELAPPSEALRLACRYTETLPVGVIGRMIAKTHDLSPRKLWWRDGIVLEDTHGTGCKALVQARWDEVRGGQGEISFAVSGRSRRAELLAVLRRHLVEIHWSFRELKTEWLVPHPDYPKSPPIPLAELEEADREGLSRYKRRMEGYGFQEVDVEKLLGRLAPPFKPVTGKLASSTLGENDEDTPPKPPYVFLSYMGEDVKTIRELREALKAEGLTVWWDKLHIPGGNAWRMVLKDAVLKGNALVSCWSTSVKGRARTVAKFEAETAAPRHQDMLDGHAFIFPVRLNQCEIPLIAVGNERLEDLQTRDLFGPKRAEALTKLVADLKRAVKRK